MLKRKEVKTMTILNTGCPHLTGVVHNGYEECEIGKACDYDCEWIELKKAEQKLEKIKDYCLKNKVAGWVDIEGIIEIIEGKDNV